MRLENRKRPPSALPFNLRRRGGGGRFHRAPRLSRAPVIRCWMTTFTVRCARVWYSPPLLDEVSRLYTLRVFGQIGTLSRGWSFWVEIEISSAGREILTEVIVDNQIICLTSSYHYIYLHFDPEWPYRKNPYLIENLEYHSTVLNELERGGGGEVLKNIKNLQALSIVCGTRGTEAMLPLPQENYGHHEHDKKLALYAV